MKVNSQVSSCFSRQSHRFLDLLHTAIVACACYLEFVTNFTNSAVVERVNWTIGVGFLFMLMLILILLNFTDLGCCLSTGNKISVPNVSREYSNTLKGAIDFIVRL